MKDNRFIQFLLIIGLLAFPIILSGQYYIDDMGRATRGYLWWGNDGRPASDFIMSNLIFSKNMIDTFPLPLIIGCVALSFSLFIFYKKNIGNGIIGVFISASYIISPSTPEILSYRFDALPLLISLSIPLIIISINTTSAIKEFLYGASLSCVVFCLYQASINLIVICFIVECTIRLSNGFGFKESMVKMFSRVLQLALAAIIYMKIILPATFSGNHSSNHPNVETGSIFDKIASNSMDYYTFLNYRFFHNNALLFIILVLSISLACSLLIIKNNKQEIINSFWPGIIATSYLLISPFIVIFFSMGVILTLENSMTYFSRLYIGLGGVSLYAGVCLSILFRGPISRYICLVMLVPLLYIYVYTYSFGAASMAQSEYTSTVISDIRSKTDEINFNYFVFSGKYLKSPILLNSEKNFPIFNFNIPNYFYNWYWPYKRFEIDGLTLPRQPSKDIVNESKENMCLSKVISKGKRFDLYIYKDVLIIDFDKSCK